MKLFYTVLFCVSFTTIHAQKIEGIYVNLYTDSLKKGTYNYISIDGKLPNGRYIPLDTTDLIFTASDGVFHGNSLYIEPNFTKEKVTIKVVLKKNPSMKKEFDMYIKKVESTERLKTKEEIMDEMNKKSKK